MDILLYILDSNRVERKNKCIMPMKGVNYINIPRNYKNIVDVESNLRGLYKNVKTLYSNECKTYIPKFKKRNNFLL